MTAGRERAHLRRLARLHGVQTSYTGYDGRRVSASAESLLAALRSLDVDLPNPEAAETLFRHEREKRRRRLGEPVEVVWTDRERILRIRHGEAVDPATIRVDLQPEGDSETIRLLRSAHDPTGFELPLELPDAAHTLRITDGQRAMHATLLAAPSTCHLPDERLLALWTPLYALRSDDSPGVATYTDLERMAAWSARRDADLFGVLPVLANFLDEPFDPSPYAPISRLFWSELFVDPRRTPEHAGETGRAICESPEFRAESDRLRRTDLLDYRAAWAHQRGALQKLADLAFRDPDRRAALVGAVERDPRLGEYARFRAETHRRAHTWRHWDAPDAVRTAPFDDEDPLQRLHLYAQMEADRQLRDAHHASRDRGAGLYLDLPVGVGGGAFDTWAFPEEFASHCSIGAPPDAFFHKGQTWGFPPPQPEAARRAGHALFRRMIASHLERCDALRIDHVMALHRLYYVPEGAEATEGVYVRQPAEELWACLTLESRRHKAVIIGENLGVVPREVNRAMHAHGALGMSVAAFEMGDDRAPLPRPTAHQAACINTHDMPTFPAFWSGEDVDLHLRVGVVDEDRAHGERHGRSHLRARLRRAFGLSEDVSPEEDTERVLMRLLEHLARSDARAVLVGLEDLLGERLPQNIPGVGDYPNWRRRARRTVEEITGDPSLGEAVERLAAARRGGDEAGPADRMEARS